VSWLFRSRQVAGRALREDFQRRKDSNLITSTRGFHREIMTRADLERWFINAIQFSEIIEARASMKK
jgi:hypothetical protein